MGPLVARRSFNPRVSAQKQVPTFLAFGLDHLFEELELHRLDPLLSRDGPGWLTSSGNCQPETDGFSDKNQLPRVRRKKSTGKRKLVG
jgi:hypothetical protein